MLIKVCSHRNIILDIYERYIILYNAPFSSWGILVISFLLSQSESEEGVCLENTETGDEL